MDMQGSSKSLSLGLRFSREWREIAGGNANRWEAEGPFCDWRQVLVGDAGKGFCAGDLLVTGERIPAVRYALQTNQPECEVGLT
jgi:hypothetical protein